MRVLVIGSGGREHALCWKLAQSPRVERVYCAPGNAGIASVAECLPVKADEVARLISTVRELGVDLTVVGPDNALADGIVNRFEKEGLRIFGPRREAAVLEWSKAFSKEFMKRHNIPTADHKCFADLGDALAYIGDCRFPVVIKADGLALGKGVVIAQTGKEARAAILQMMSDKLYGSAGEKVVIEEYLAGQEISLLAFTDGQDVVPMLPVQDHKQLSDGDRGPNTGGMGTICPVPFVSRKLVDDIVTRVLRPAVRGMA
ncbi:MAG: phosphoribosylamine--glycine ligase, partial [Bacillota bacterium]